MTGRERVVQKLKTWGDVISGCSLNAIVKSVLFETVLFKGPSANILLDKIDKQYVNSGAYKYNY